MERSTKKYEGQGLLQGYSYTVILKFVGLYYFFNQNLKGLTNHAKSTGTHRT